MRRTMKGTLTGVFVITGVLGYLGMSPVQSADPTDMPPTSPSSPTTQAPAPQSTPAPQGQGTQGERRKKAMHRMKEACGADIQKFCQNVKRGEGRIVQCLEQHPNEVSQNCSQLLQKKASRQGKTN
ncbi:MAG: cysteine rich repeat-containing protein [Nitrospiraceae bacterium]